MSCKPILRETSHNQPDTSAAHATDLPIDVRPHADAEMTRVLMMPPIPHGDPTSGVIADWQHGVRCTTSSHLWTTTSS